MGKKQFKITSIIQPGDVLALVVVVCGILIALFLDGLAIKLIGVSISILGGLALVMLISQRLGEIVDSGKFNLKAVQPDFKMTVIKDSAAKRQTIENFEEKFDTASDIKEQTAEIPTYMGSDEGFRIVSKTARMEELKKNEAKNDIEERIRSHAKDVKQESKNPEMAPTGTVIVPKDVNIKAKQADVKSAKPAVAAEPIKSVAAEAERTFETVIKAEDIPQVIEPAKIEENVIEQVIEEVPAKIEVVEPTPAVETPVQEMPEAIAPDPEPIAEAIVEPEPIVPEPVIEHAMPEPIISPVAEALAEQVIPEPEIIEEETAAEAVEEPFELFADEASNSAVSEELQAATVEGDALYGSATIDFPLSVLMDDDPLTGKEPRKEFEFFISRILIIIRSVINARTVSFILVNQEKNELILESYVTNVPDAIKQSLKLPISRDVVSQIVSNAKPEILTEINSSAELDLIPYYAAPVGTSSFVGVPVFYNKTVIGIICADTIDKDAYDAATVAFLGNFTKLLSALVQSYTEKYDLLQASKTLEAIDAFNAIAAKGSADNTEIGNALVNTVAQMFEYTSMGLCTFDEQRGGWYINSFITTDREPSFIKNEPVNLNESVIGKAIINCESIVIPNCDGAGTLVNPKEHALPGTYFAAIPVKSSDNTFGALFIEGKGAAVPNNFDIKIIETLGESAGSIIEKLHIMNLFQTSAVVDQTTGVLNNYAFARRLQEEIARSHDYKTPITLCLFSIDSYSAFDSEENFEQMERINNHIIDIINKYTRQYDIFGKLNPEVYAVVLVGMNPDTSKIWAEKVRNEAAISVVEVNNRRLTATLSLGLSGLYSDDDANSMFGNAHHALDIALSKSNSVQVFQ